MPEANDDDAVFATTMVRCDDDDVVALSYMSLDMFDCKHFSKSRCSRCLPTVLAAAYAPVAQTTAPNGPAVTSPTAPPVTVATTVRCCRLARNSTGIVPRQFGSVIAKFIARMKSARLLQPCSKILNLCVWCFGYGNKLPGCSTKIGVRWTIARWLLLFVQSFQQPPLEGHTHCELFCIAGKKHVSSSIMFTYLPAPHERVRS
jgi:hypothetical protein